MTDDTFEVPTSGIAKVSLLTADEQIARVEALVEAGEVEQLITVAYLRHPERVAILTMGASPATARWMLRTALEGCDVALGKDRR